MDMITTENSVLQIVPSVDEAAYGFRGSLHFLEGHFLFCYEENGVKLSKFLAPEDVSAAFSQSEQDTGWLPAGVVRAGRGPRGEWFVYSTPAQKVIIQIEDFHHRDTEPTEKDKGKSEKRNPGVIEIPIPRLLLMGYGNQYYLWAMASKHFGPYEPVYYAPFPNIYESGQICWGANNLPRASAGSARKAWQLFFNTPFNGHLASGKTLRHNSDARELLRALAGKAKFPAAELVRTGRMAGDMVNEILKRNNR